MNRLSLNQTDVERNRDLLREPEAGYETPCPGSVLALDSDIQWLEFIDGRVLWGHPDPLTFYAYCPDIFGDSAVPLDITYVNDHAPLDPEAPSMPLYPEEPAAMGLMSKGGEETAEPAKKLHGRPREYDEKRALQDLLKRLTPEQQKKVRELARQKRPDLLGGGKDGE